MRVFFALVATSTLLSGCKEQSAATDPADRTRPVLVQHVAFEDRIPERRLVATIRPRVEADLSFRVGGKVAVRLVDVGERVVTGQVLGRLDEIDIRLQREQAVAERDAAAASMTQAQADFHRATTLAGEGWTAASTADRQRAATEEARGRLLRAERALTLAENASTYTLLRADADGIVTAAPIEPGQVVSAGQLAVRIAHTGEKEAEVAIPEVLVDRVREGHAALTLWADPTHVFPAQLRELAPAADPSTRTYRARYSLADAGSAQLGMTGTLALKDPAAERVARLPLSALFDQGSGPSVWLVDADGHLTLAPVAVAKVESHDVLVAGGVHEGDAVVSMGAQKLDPGLRVHVVDALQF